MKTTKLSLLIVLFFCFKLGNAQIIKSRLDLVGGFGLREYIHGGIRYQYLDFTQFGFYIGSDSEVLPNESITTFSIDHMVHFGDLSFLSNRSVWYFRQGYTYSHNLMEHNLISNISFVNLGFGREFAFNDYIGINIDLGTALKIREKEINNVLNTEYISNKWTAVPMGRVQFFFSF